jgi:uncharacterized BrkB/YihY/UPF0761 family membrane protein
MENMLLTVLALLVLIICGGCVYAFVHAIFLFIFSHGDEEKKKSAWNSIRYMIIGVILTIFLLTVFPVVFRQLKVTGYEVYTARNVFERSGEIINQLFRFTQIVRDTNTSQ